MMSQSPPASSRSADGPVGRVVVVGHVCVDIIPSWPHHAADQPASVTPGVLLQVGPATISTGGAVSNTGLALHRLGVPVTLIGRIGNDLFGEAIVAAFRTAGVPADGMSRAAGESTSYSLVISPPGVDRSFLHCPGANKTFNPDEVDVSRLADGEIGAGRDSSLRILHFGYPQAMRGTYADGGERLAHMFERAKGAGMVTSLDTCFPDISSDAGKVDWGRFFERVLPHVDVFAPSWDELILMLDGAGALQRATEALRGASASAGGGSAGSEMMFGRRGWVHGAARRILSMGAAVSVIKLGEFGLHVAATLDGQRFSTIAAVLGLDPTAWIGRECSAAAFEVAVKGTTGAGDTTIAGFLAAMLDGESLERAVQFAAAVGACCVEAADAVSGIPAACVVRERITAGWRTRGTHWAGAGWSAAGVQGVCRAE